MVDERAATRIAALLGKLATRTGVHWGADWPRRADWWISNGLGVEDLLRKEAEISVAMCRVAMLVPSVGSRLTRLEEDVQTLPGGDRRVRHLWHAAVFDGRHVETQCVFGPDGSPKVVRVGDSDVDVVVPAVR